MIETRSVVVAKDYVVAWHDISDGLCEKLGLEHLRDGKGGPGFDFWMYWTGEICEYLPDSISDDAVDLDEEIDCAENDGKTYPHEHDLKAVPILKALRTLLAEEVIQGCFYVDYT